MATVLGASVPYPFGGKIRQVLVYLDREKLQAKGLTLDDVTGVVNSTNQILPSGDAKIGPKDWYIYSNGKLRVLTTSIRFRLGLDPARRRPTSATW
jgi:hydrophobic/amphiphilic exporter-1 (mainly G- bacteria), HAE1 family